MNSVKRNTSHFAIIKTTPLFPPITLLSYTGILSYQQIPKHPAFWSICNFVYPFTLMNNYIVLSPVTINYITVITIQIKKQSKIRQIAFSDI